MTRLEQLQNLLAAQPDDAFLLFAIAKEHEGAANFEAALAHYSRLRETTPQYVGLYYHLGKLFEKLERPDDALETYRTGMSIAKAERDNHSYSELAAAKMDLTDEDDDEY
ncbi:MAG: tetratricopeptide repeat protein [Saprospiraceae bacterium]|nr:tetratricopeptide repeat protein [Saprospiraceae bacterium]